MKTVIQIVSNYLTSIGANGLVCPDAECGCKLDDLAPCGGDFGGCQPGYISKPTDPVECNWLMWPTKELAEQQNARINAIKEGGAA